MAKNFPYPDRQLGADQYATKGKPSSRETRDGPTKPKPKPKPK